MPRPLPASVRAPFGGARRRWALPLVLLVAVGCGAVGGAWGQRQDAEHEATAVILINPLLGSPFSPDSSRDQLVDLETEAHLVTSDQVAREVAQQVTPQGGDRAATAASLDEELDGISVAVPPNTQLLEISARASGAALATARAQAFAETYLEHRRARAESERLARASKVDDQIAERSRQLERTAARLEAADPRGPQALLLSQEIIEITSQVGELRTQRAALEAQPSSPGLVVSPATATPGPPLGWTVIGVAAGFLLGLAGATFLLMARARRDQTLHDEADLAAVLARREVPLLGSSDAPSGIRTGLVAGHPQRPLVVVLATVGMDPGATTCAGGLAAGLARSERETVLVDLGEPDAAPDVHPGLSDLLQGRVTVEDVLDDEVGVPGRIGPGSAARLLDDLTSSPRMRQVVEHLRKRSDVVLVAGGPLEGPRTRALVAHADAVVLEMGGVTEPQVDAALDEVRRSGRPLAGAVWHVQKVSEPARAHPGTDARTDPPTDAPPAVNGSPAHGSSAVRHLDGLARGGAVALLGAACSAVCGFALVIVVTRGLPADRAGVFFAATALFLVVTALADLGTETGLARFLLRQVSNGRPQDVRATIRTAARPAMLASIVGAALLLLLAEPAAVVLGIGREDATVFRVLALAVPCAVAAELCLSTTRAMTDMRTTAVVDRIVRAGLQPALAFAALATGGGLLLVGAGWAAAYVVSAVLALVAARRFLRRRLPDAELGEPGKVAAEFWSFTWPRGLTRLAQIIMQKADIVLVAVLLSPVHAAIYTAATRFVALGQFATQAIQQAIQPRLTLMLAHDDRATLREVYRVATAWNIALTWPIYLVIGCAPAAYLSIFGNGYGGDSAQLVVLIMLGAMLFAVATGPVDTLLLMSGRSRASLANALTAVAIDLSLCVWLVPRYGIAGAAVAWAAAVTTRCGLAFVQVRRALGVTPLGREVAVAANVSVLVVALPVGAFALTGGERLMPYLTVALACAAAYVVALWMLRRPLRLDLLVSALRGRSVRNPEESPMTSRRRSRIRRLVGRIRSHLPGPVVNLARFLALAWGRLTAGLRMRPAFIVVGAQRCGTTTMFRLLEEHPDLVRPTLSKGTGYFDDDYHRSERWYRAHFPLVVTGWLRSRSLKRAQTFECSGYYLFHPLAAQRIAATLPGVRLVVLVRDPVERAYSAHRHELLRGYDRVDFDTAVALEPERTADEAHRLEQDPSYRSYSHRHHAYLARSRYAEQVARLVAAVGRDRVRVIDADQFFADPVPEFLSLQRWLGLRPWTPPRVPHWNARPRDPLPDHTREALLAYFEADDTWLERYLGHAPSWRAARRTPQATSGAAS